MTISGTKEWSTSSVNVCSGCSHDCLYCYAKAQAIRFRRKTPETWREEELLPRKGYGKRVGRIMLPTTHDITTRTMVRVAQAAGDLLDAGNELLIVSKPECNLLTALTAILAKREHARKRVTFRLSIGSYLDETLRFWEPGAPTFASRFASLARLYHDGWQTSVSCEPMLERRERMVELVEMLAPLVTDTIWLGKMNQARARLSVNGATNVSGWLCRLDAIERAQADGEIRLLYKALKDHPLVRWKGSIKKVVGIETPSSPGMDI
jgi:DNA repair photolyase